MKIIAVIQARMGSSRLPGKVLRVLGGLTVLERICRSARSAPALEGVVVATSTSPQDDAVAEHCREIGFSCYRGSEEDVLARFEGASAGADAVVRITGDCPLYDGQLLQEMLIHFQKLAIRADELVYLSNTLRRTFPRGLDTEIFTRAALDKAAQEAKTVFEREHVTPYFYQNPELFKLHNFSTDSDFSDHRWTLDTVEDWRFMEAVASNMNNDFVWNYRSILRLLEKWPAIVKINQHVRQKSH